MKEPTNRDAIMAGAGIGGLAAAIRLQCLGYQVHVLEKNAQPGGKIGQFKQDGFRFDTGPTLLTMPWLVDELYELAGKSGEKIFDYKPLKEGTQYWFSDGTQISPGNEREAFINEVGQKTKEPQKTLRKFLDNSKTLYGLTAPVFLERSLHDRANYFRLTTLKTLLRFPPLKLFRTMNRENRKTFSDSRVRQLFNRYATFNGSNPYQTPAVFNVIPHLEHNLGAYYPQGGMYSLVESLYQLAKSIGVSFSFNETIEAINLKDGRINEIQTKTGFSAKPRLIVSNIDAETTYRNLLPSEYYPSFYLNREKSSSALIFYWNIQGDHPQLKLHNIFFANDYQEEFTKLFKEKDIPSDPTVYVYISSKANPDDAEEGGENWYVMINAPIDIGQEWDELRKKGRTFITKKLSKDLGYDITPYILKESYWSPKGIENDTGSAYGALYGNSSNSQFSAFLRHPNYSPKIKGLYFCGGSVHPGGGIPLCLNSAKIVSDLVRRNINL